MTLSELTNAAEAALARAGELAQLGGPVVGVLAAMSVAGLAVLLAKLWQFHRLRLSDLRPVERALARYRAGDAAGALAALRDQPNPVAATVAEAIATLVPPPPLASCSGRRRCAGPALGWRSCGRICACST